MNYKELTMNNDYLVNKLTGDYLETAKDIDFYLDSKLKSKVRVKILMSDILNMLYESQQSESSIDEVIGKDVKNFCDGILESVEYPSIGEKILEFLDDKIFLILIIPIINILFHGMGNASLDNLLTSKIEFHIEEVLIFIPSYAIYYIVKKIFKQYGKPNQRKMAKSWMIIATSLIILIILLFFEGKKSWIIEINTLIYILIPILGIMGTITYRFKVNKITQEATDYREMDIWR